MAMPERAEIKRVAREMLGASLAWGGIREYGLLARLLAPDEPIEAMALGRRKGTGLIGSQRLIVATPRRLLLVEKGFLTGRERVEEIAWPSARGVSVSSLSRLELETETERLSFTFVQPPRQLGALADLVRRRIDPGLATAPGSGELQEMAQRKLGRLLGTGVQAHVLALAAQLEPDEQVLELAYVAQGREGLLAATTRRLLFVPSRGLAGVDETASLLYSWLEGVRLTEPDVIAATAGGQEVTWAGVTPPERALGLVEIASARC